MGGSKNGSGPEQGELCPGLGGMQGVCWPWRLLVSWSLYPGPVLQAELFYKANSSCLLSLPLLLFLFSLTVWSLLFFLLCTQVIPVYMARTLS